MHSGTPASGTDASLLSVVIGVLVAVGYLTVGWAMVVRTGGTAVLGLRVLSTGRSRLGWARAFLRAVLCVIFPLGVLWSAVSRERRSLQDLLVRSVVVYDWHHTPADGTRFGAAVGTARWRPSLAPCTPALAAPRSTSAAAPATW